MLTLPDVGFIPTHPHHIAGVLALPPISEAIPKTEPPPPIKAPSPPAIVIGNDDFYHLCINQERKICNLLIKTEFIMEAEVRVI